MRRVFLIIVLGIFSQTMFAQNSNLVGSWLMTKAEFKDQVEEPFQIAEFNENGHMIMMGIDLATWKLDGKKIIMESEIEKDFNGESTIVKLTKTDLVLTKEGATFTYIKVNKAEINKTNSASDFIGGVWQIENNEGTTRILKFEAPDTFTYVDATDGMTSNASGTWIYNPKENTLLLMGFAYEIRGKFSIKKLDKETLELVGTGTSFKAIRENTDEISIERLIFEEDSFSEDQDFSDQLPWKYFEEMVSYLKNVDYLKFRHATLLDNINTMKYSTTYSTLEVDQDNPKVVFTNISINQTDTMQYSQNYKDNLAESNNYFFPKEEPWPYKVVGTETITVLAGTFECIVVTGFEYETKFKFWMINDKPGVYAKVITEEVDPFDELTYKVVELEEIKLK